MTQKLEQGSLLNGGMITGLPGFAIGRNESPLAVNVDPANPLGAVTRPGSSQYGTDFTTASGFIGTGIFPWTRNNGTQFIFANYGTTIYSMNVASGWTAVKNSVATDSIMQGAGLNDVAVLVASGIAPQVSTAGSTLADLGGTPPSLAKFVTVYSSKMWLAGDPNNASRVDFSASNDPEDYTTADNAGYVEIEKDDGDLIKGIKGTKRALYVFKRKNAYALTGVTAFDFQVELLCSWGVVGEYATASDGQGCFFASDDGIYYASGMHVARISDPMRETYLNISDKSTVALEVKGEKLFVFYDSDGDGLNDRCMVLAFKRMMPDGSVRGVWAEYSSQPFRAVKTGRDFAMYAATNGSTAQIYELDTGDSDASIQWDTPDLDFGQQYVNKKFTRFFLHVKPNTATTNITVRMFADGNSFGSDYSFSGATAGSYEILQGALGGVSIPRARHYRARITVTEGPRTVYGWQMVADVPTDDMGSRR